MSNFSCAIFTTISLCFVQQPQNVYRMRYSKEKRYPILRAQNDNGGRINIQYPKIKIYDERGCSGVLYLTCCNAEEGKPNGYAVHPNKLHEWNTKQKEPLQTGVVQIPYKLNPSETEIEIELANLYIEHVCGKDFDEIISNVKQVTEKFDPFYMGVEENGKYDFDKIRLCCQVVSSDARMSEPLVSEVIKQNSFEITKIIHNRGIVTGGDEMVLFINNLPKFKKKKNEEEQLIVRFYEEEGANKWTKDVLIDKKEIHHSCALVVPTPPYHNTEICRNKEVKFNFYKGQNDTYDPIESEDNVFVYTPIKTLNKRSNENASLPDYRSAVDDENGHHYFAKRQKSVHASNTPNERSFPNIITSTQESPSTSSNSEWVIIDTSPSTNTLLNTSPNTQTNNTIFNHHQLDLINNSQTNNINNGDTQSNDNNNAPLDSNNNNVTAASSQVDEENWNIDIDELFNFDVQSYLDQIHSPATAQSPQSSSAYNHHESPNPFIRPNVDDFINDKPQT